MPALSVKEVWSNPFSALSNKELKYSSALSQLKIPSKTGTSSANSSYSITIT